MKHLNRRDAMIRVGMGTAGLLCKPAFASSTTTRHAADLARLAERFRKTSRDAVLGVATQAIQHGADYQTLLGAAFMAGVHDVRPRSVGGKLHCVMMVDSAFQLAAAAPAKEAWLAALWSVDDFKNSQARDLGEGDWVLPARPKVTFSSEAKAREAFRAAMDAWDAEAADRALAGLLPFHDRESFFELLWPYAARCYVDIGHKIIFCAQVERAIQRLGWHLAEPALRSLVNGLLYVFDDISGSELAVFDHARALIPKFPSDWQTGKEDPSQSEVLLRKLRDCDANKAQELVVAAFDDGLGPATVWDSLRLYASEILHRRPTSAARRHGPVHGVTEVNAFAYIWRTTRVETTKRLMILQAAGWLPLMRRDLIRFFGEQQGPGLDALGIAEPGKLPEIPELFEQLSPDLARSRLDTGRGNRALFVAQLRDHLVHRAFQSHQYKYAAAIQEESVLIHPRWSSRVLAPAVTYLPTANDPQTEVARRSLHALRQAGIT